jgi:type I restriction enzyme M protein
MPHPSPWLRDSFDVVLTHPPFAGEVDARGFELATITRGTSCIERDALLLERALELLRPGGRIGIVLPHGKRSGPAWKPLRTFVHQRARVLATISLPKDTFLPHSGQRTAVLFAIKRNEHGAERPRTDEPVLLGVSERPCRDNAGEPRADHDLEPLAHAVAEQFRTVQSTFGRLSRQPARRP